MSSLVIDDEPGLRRSLRAYPEDRGCGMLETVCGREGLALLENLEQEPSQQGDDFPVKSLEATRHNRHLHRPLQSVSERSGHEPENHPAQHAERGLGGSK